MSLPPEPNPSEPEIPSWLHVVENKVSALRFGSVQIVVHEGRVTQIESTEKFRFVDSLVRKSRRESSKQQEEND